MNIVVAPTLLEETINLFKNVRASMVKAMVNLYALRENNEWADSYSTWGEFVEDGLGISQGFASKLLTVHKAYLLDGGLDENAIAGIDYEKLYAARELPGTPEERVAMAKVLTRRELKDTKNEASAHEHIEVKICKVCGVRLG